MRLQEKGVYVAKLVLVVLDEFMIPHERRKPKQN